MKGEKYMKDFKILQIQLCPVKLQIFVLSNLRNVDIRWHWTYRRKYAALSPHQDTFTLNSLSPVPRNKAAKSVLTSPDLQTPGGEGGGNTGICVVWCVVTCPPYLTRRSVIHHLHILIQVSANKKPFIVTPLTNKTLCQTRPSLIAQIWPRAKVEIEIWQFLVEIRTQNKKS